MGTTTRDTKIMEIRKDKDLVPPVQPLQEQFEMKDSSVLVSFLYRYTLATSFCQTLRSRIVCVDQEGKMIRTLGKSRNVNLKFTVKLELYSTDIIHFY